MAKYEIYKTLVLSTAHITEEDSELLEEIGDHHYSMVAENIDFPAVTIGEFGWRVLIPDEDYLIPPTSKLSAAFWGLVDEARKEGCRWLELDRDADAVQHLEVFEW